MRLLSDEAGKLWLLVIGCTAADEDEISKAYTLDRDAIYDRKVDRQMADVFISYSSKDKQVADTLCAQIEQQGYSCWIAPRDIIPGEDWARSINTAITAAKVFIVIYSRNSCESSQVPKEIGIAGARDLSIIPYKIDDTPLAGDFEYYLLGSHWVAADPFKGDYKIGDVLAAVERAIARREGREPSAVTITNNYAGDNNSVINVQRKDSVGAALKIAVVAAVALLLAAVVIIVLLLTDRGKDANSSSQPDVSAAVVTEEAKAVHRTQEASAAATAETKSEPLSYFEAQAIYSEMVHTLLRTASQNSYSGFVQCFDDTYTDAEIAEIYSVIAYSSEMNELHISMFEFTDDTIFGMYSFYENAYEGMPVHYHCDFVDEANVLVRYGDEWRFSRLSQKHPLYATIEQMLYPYGTDTDDNYTILNYQTAASTVLCDHFMVEVVNICKNEDDTITVRFELINGDYGFPTELNVSLNVYDYDGNALLCMDEVAFDTNIACGEIQFYEITSEPIENIDDVDLSFIYYDSYVHASFG